MDSGAVVLDISSDDEDSCLNEEDGSPPDWFSELLDHADEVLCDSEDVVVVDELSCAAVAPKQNSAAALDKTKGVVAVGSDDECMILDEDPDKLVDVRQDKGDSSDDLQIIGEKGQLACRDYPHSRHLCATFPFSTTPHEKYCDQCHCYVCDSLAPCALWGNGASSTDHCHSTDKEERWKLQRKSSKQATSATQSEKVADNILPTPPLNKSGPLPSRIVINPILTPPMTQTLRACSASIGTPSIISQRHRQRPAILHPRPRFAQQSYRTERLIPANHGAERGRHAGVLPPRVHPAFPNFKRVSSSGGSFMGIHVNRSRQGFAVHNQMHRAITQKNHQPMTIALHNQSPPVTIPEKNQHRPAGQVNGANYMRLQEILAGLESELGISDNNISNTVESSPGMFFSDVSSPSFHAMNSTQNAGPIGRTVSCYNGSNMADCRPCAAPSQTNVCPDATVVWNTRMTTDVNSLSPDVTLSNDAPRDTTEPVLPEDNQPPAVQSTSLPVASNSNPFSEDASNVDWVAYLEQDPSTETSKDPEPVTEDSLVFDFEDAWSGL